MKQNFKRKLLAGLLSACMIFQTVGIVPVYAAENVMDSGLPIGTSSVCTHHEHDEKCGYTEGTPCTHEHTEECSAEVTKCVHEHTAECYPVQDSGEATGSDAKEPTACTHICDEKSGCVTKELACKHVHDDKCGYTEGTPCTFDPATCESCKAKKTVDNRATFAGEVYAVWDGSTFYAATADAPSTATSEEILSTDKKTINHLYITGESVRRSLMTSCTSLASVEMPEVTDIGTQAFWNCTSLTSVAMPKAITIGISAFERCTALASVEMPEVTTIGNQAFYGCTKLASVAMPNASNIEQGAFSGCTALASVAMPKAITIGDNAFSGCTSLESVAMPKAITIGDNAFYGCTKLASAQLSKVSTIGDNAFSGCTSLASVAMPKAITIGLSAFESCTSLASVEMPSATTIDMSAFNGCTALLSVTMPSATSIGIRAFESCTALTTIEMPKATTIDYMAFYGCTTLTSAKMPNVTTIGEDAFRGCSVLTSAKMPNVTTIGKCAFRNCEKLESVEIPNVTEIGEKAFYLALKLTSLTLGATPPTVGTDAFARHATTTRNLIIQGNTAYQTEVLAAYNTAAGNDGNATDNLWYDWTLPTTMVVAPSAGTLAVTTGNSNPTFGTDNAITLTATFDKAAKIGRQRALAINEVEFKDGANTLGAIATATKNSDGKWVATLNVNTKDWAVGAHNLTATFAGNHELGDATATLTITVGKSGTTFDGGITVDKTDKTYTYGDTITVKATPKATGIAARLLTAPTANQMALFVGNTQISQAVDGTNGVYTMTYDTTEKGLAVGSNIITAKYVGNESMADYSETVTVTLNQKAITSASVNAGATKVYDGTNSFTGVALTPNASGILSGDTITATADGTAADANVGATKAFTATSVTLGGTDAGYYSLATDKVSGNVAITKANAAGISQEYPVVNGLAKDYTFDLSKLLPSISSTQEYGSVTYTVASTDNASSVLTASPTNSDIANGKLTLKVASVADKDKTATVTMSITSDNFTVTNAVITVKTVDKIPLTISHVTMAERVYSGSAYAYTGTPTFTNTTDNTAVTGVSFTKEYEGRNGTSYTKSATAPTNAGEYNLILTVSGASASTYAGTLTVPFAITPKEVTVKAKDKDILVGAGIPSLSNPTLNTDYTTDGFIGGDSLGGTVSMSYTGAPDNTKHGSYPITISGGTVSDNYTVKYETGTLTISIDVSLITAAITAADNAKGGIAIYDTAASSVENGTKFVTTSEMSTLNTAIQTATNAKASCTTLEQVQAAVKALDDAVADFKAAIKTGTYTAPSGGGGGVIPTPDPTAPIQPKEHTITNADGTKTTVILFDGTKSGTPAKGEALLSAEALAKIAAVKGAGAVVATSTSIVQFDQKALQAITGGQTKGNIKVIAEIVSPDTLTPEQKALLGDNALIIDLSVENENGKVTDFNGGTATVVIKIPAGVDPTTLGAVYIKTNGKLEKVEGKVVMVNGVATFQFVTNHFSKFAVLDKATIDKAIAAQDAMAKDKLVKGVKATKLTAIKAVAKKSNVTVTWKKSKGYKVDGYQIWKSSKKTTGYKMMAKRTGQKYKNTYGLKAGKTYYYKVRGFREIDGKIVYTKWAKAKVVAK